MTEVRVRTPAEAGWWLESRGFDAASGVWDPVADGLVRWSGDIDVQFVVDARAGAPLSAAELVGLAARRRAGVVADPTWMRPGLLSAVAERAQQGRRLLALAADEAGWEPAMADLDQALAAVWASLAPALGRAPAAPPAGPAAPVDPRAGLPEPPFPLSAMQAWFDAGGTLVDDAMDGHPNEALLRDPAGALVWIEGEEAVAQARVVSGADATRDDLRWRWRPTDAARRCVAASFPVGAAVEGAVRALQALAAVRVLLSTPVADGGRFTVFEVVETRPYDRRWALALVSDGSGRVGGTYVLSGIDAWDQVQFLVAVAGPDGAQARATAMADGLAAALAGAFSAFVDAAADPDALRALTDTLRPGPGDVGAGVIEAWHGEAERRVAGMWASDPVIDPGGPGRRVHVDVATGGQLATGLGADAFPTGWRRLAAVLRPESVWACVRFAPEGGGGNRYDGLLWCGERWVWLPKLWRD